MKTPKIAVIGAGIAGLACARGLAGRGLDVVVFDKGRGLGGRLSTRRTDGGYQFDHGTQCFTAQSERFLSILAAAKDAGAVAHWPKDCNNLSFVGVPGMTGFAKYLGHGLDIRRRVRIEKIIDTGAGWQLLWRDGRAEFDRVVVTAPAPQIAQLLPVSHDLLEPLRAVQMEPCLALMIALRTSVEESFDFRQVPGPGLLSVALDGTKPERPDATCLVVHANAEWSRQHLELELDLIAERMLPLVSTVLGYAIPADPPYLAAHRWRYARTTSALGQAFLADDQRRLIAAGDWCLGATVEDAWTSGTAAAQALAGAIKG